jgi:hypothetical protein
LVKFFRVVGARTGTATSGGLFVVVDGWGLTVGVLAGVAVVGVAFEGVGGAIFAGAGVFGVGAGVRVDLEGGVTVIAGATIPSVRLAIHKIAIVPGLMLVGFMVSTSCSIR